MIFLPSLAPNVCIALLQYSYFRKSSTRNDIHLNYIYEGIFYWKMVQFLSIIMKKTKNVDDSDWCESETETSQTWDEVKELLDAGKQ